MIHTEPYTRNLAEVTREVFFGVGGPDGPMKWGIYPFFFVALLFLGYSIYSKVLIWRRGKEELRTDQPMKRLLAVFKYVILQAKVLRENTAGIMHAALFFGFIGLFITTAIITIQTDVTSMFFGITFLKGNVYLLWSLLGDVSGFIVLIGLVIAIIRRYLVKPSRLDTTAGDSFTLILLALVIISGFAAEAMRIALTNFPPFEIWSPVGFVLALPFSKIDDQALQTLHTANWWVHMIGAFLFIALMGTGKTGHIITTTLNVLFGNLNNERPETKYTMPLIDPGTFETAESFGVSRVEEYTWKHLLDADACTRCGRCQDSCPAHLTEKPLSPKKIVNDIRANMYERIPKLIGSRDPSAVATTPLIGGSVKPDEFWSCTNCAACMEQCPVNIEHVPKMAELRRHQVLMEGDMAPELQTTFVNMENNYNPYGFAFAERGAWLPADLGVKTLAEDPDVDFCYFVGCAASFDKRNQKVAVALLSILKKAGYRVGILGAEEACCGDAAMRAGNEYLFHSLAAANLEAFGRYGVKKIITACPHGYNILKKEYKAFTACGADADGNPLYHDYSVFHHTEIISDIIKRGLIALKNPIDETITYHDSCFLGRYNEIYNEPREALGAIPGVRLMEMSRHHEGSFCCGAGGARMFIEEHLGTRINQSRTRDARDTGATAICSACPFCMTMLSDGAVELDFQDLETYDLAELVYRAMEK